MMMWHPPSPRHHRPNNATSALPELGRHVGLPNCVALAAAASASLPGLPRQTIHTRCRQRGTMSLPSATPSSPPASSPGTSSESLSPLPWHLPRLLAQSPRWHSHCGAEGACFCAAHVGMHVDGVASLVSATSDSNAPCQATGVAAVAQRVTRG